MTLVAVPELLLYHGAAASSTSSAYLLDAAGEKAALVLQAPKAGTIDRLGFVTGTLTTGDTVDVRLETVGTDGNPSGSLWATNTNGSVAVAAASTGYEATLTAGATVDRDDFLAVVIVNGSTPGNFLVAGMTPLLGSGPPNGAQFTSGAWSRSPTAIPTVWIRYNDGSYAYIPGVLPGTVTTSPALSSTSTPDEIGMKITVPAACKVGGLWAFSADTSTPDLTAKLYDSGGSVLESVVIDGDYVSLSSPALKVHRLRFDTEVNLAAGDVVRATLLLTTTTSFSVPRILSLISDSAATAYPHGGAAVGTERTDGGSWTDDTDRLYPVGLILTAIDNGASTGGGVGAGIRTIGSSVARSVI